MSARSSCQRGAAAAEFVLVLPALLFLVLGIVDWGYYFCVREVAIHAAREGARVGSLLDHSAADGAAAAKAFLQRVGYCVDGADVGNASAGGVAVKVTCKQTVVTKFFPEALIPRTLTVSAEIRHE
jgi:Flp pilus assembly protein TadG